jgi:hypothetical protein
MRLACAAETALLLWTGLYEQDRSDAPDLQMALLRRRGDAGRPRVTVLERGTAEEGPAVASGGQGFLVAWRPRQDNGARVAVFGTRVDPAGLALDQPARELGSLNAGHAVSAHWDGAQYVLIGIQALGVGDFQLRGRRVGPDLGRLDPEWFSIDRISSRRGTGALATAAAVGPGVAALVYEAFPDDDPTGNQRLFTRLLHTSAIDLTPAPVEPAPARVRGGDCAIAPRSSPADLRWLLVVAALLWLRRRW